MASRGAVVSPVVAFRAEVFRVVSGASAEDPVEGVVPAAEAQVGAEASVELVEAPVRVQVRAVMVQINEMALRERDVATEIEIEVITPPCVEALTKTLAPAILAKTRTETPRQLVAEVVRCPI